MTDIYGIMSKSKNANKVEDTTSSSRGNNMILHQKDSEEGKDFNEQSSNRPRRIDSETLTYLRTLEPLIDSNLYSGKKVSENEEMEDGQEPVEEDQSLLVGNLIDELVNKVASLAMDRHAAPILEKLARLCSKEQLTSLLEGCVGYAECLATNRYSSHVLQTLFSLTGPMIEQELHGDGETEEEEMGQMLRKSVLTIAQELKSSWISLIHDLCGTHTIRALFCVLTGMPVIAERRGRHAKHQHSIETAVSANAVNYSSHNNLAKAAWNENIHKLKLSMHDTPTEFETLIESMTVELGELDLMLLHQALCDAYAGPAICLMIQSIARKEGPDSLWLSDKGSMLNKVVKKALGWGCSSSTAETEEEDDGRSSEIIYAMAGEPLSSRFLETVLWHTPPTIAEWMFRISFQGKVMEFVEDEVANFVLQTWLQRTDCRKQLKAVLEEIAPNMEALLHRQRAGVIWRLAGACLRLQKHEKKFVRALRASLGEKEDVIVQRLLGLSSTKQSHGQDKTATVDNRLSLNVPGARTVDCLIRMPSSISQGFCQAIIDLPKETLLAIVKDNLGSRTLLDPLLQLSMTEPRLFGPSVEALARKLEGTLADVAIHPVGFHLLTKCFRSIGVQGKKKMAEELVNSESSMRKLTGAHFGRRVLSELAISLYRSNPSKWETTMVQNEKRRQILEEIFDGVDGPVSSSSSSSPAPSSSHSSTFGASLKKKEEKKKGGKVPPIMEMLLGQEKASSLRNKKVQVDADVTNLDFVLNAIKATSKEIKSSEIDGGGIKKSTSSRGQHPNGKERSLSSKDKKSRKTVDKAVEKKFKTVKLDSVASMTPIEKAKRILGNKAMMSKGELWSAVDDLEKDYQRHSSTQVKKLRTK